MVYEITIVRIQRWNENEYEGTIECAFDGHHLSCRAPLSGDSEWRRIHVGECRRAEIWLERSGAPVQILNTTTPPRITQISGVNYELVGPVEDRDGERVVLNCSGSFSVDLSPPTGETYPKVRRGAIILVKGVMQIDLGID
jgi:hypothetical protein